MSEQPAPAWGETWPPVDQFRKLAKQRRVIPVVRRVLADDLTPVGIYRRLAHDKVGSFILESAQTSGGWHRWSFVGVRAQATLVAQGNNAQWLGDPPVSVPREGHPLQILNETLQTLHSPPLEGLPPLTGGLVGSLGWDACWYFDPDLPRIAPDELGFPDMAFMLVAEMVAIDHHDGSAWLIANAINNDDAATGVDRAYGEAVARLDELGRRLTAASPTVVNTQTDTELKPALRLSQGEFEHAVQTVVDRIQSGTASQVVISNRFDVSVQASPLDVYRALRTINPSPYMYMLHLPGGPGGEFHVVGSSPETLVKVTDRAVTTFPIAGSRPRGKTPAQDLALEEDLLKDAKEVHEHQMLVELAKQDLARVCPPATIRVVDPMRIQRFSHIMHITSTVTGELQENKSALDTLRVAFPAGTLSGSPRDKAIAMIEEVEPARRGIFGGAVGYFDFAGNMDMAIAIRTAVISQGIASIQAGAGVVADSHPRTEYLETRSKAQAALRAVELANGLLTLE